MPQNTNKNENIKKKLDAFRSDSALAQFIVTMNLENKLDEVVEAVKETNPVENPEFKFSLSALEKIMEGLEQVKGAKGDPGHTPTDEELLALIKPLIPEVRDGKDGEDGKTPTESELLALIRPLVDSLEQRVIPTDTRLKKLIRPLIPEVRDGVDGENGQDGSPDTAEQVRDKLESLEGENRLDASAIKNLPKIIKEKSAQMIAGGIRFLERLVDVSVDVTSKRQDLLLQYNQTNKRWEDGVALTVSATAPTNPKINDLWVDIS